MRGVTADEELDPERYARITAALASGRERDEVLAEHGLDEETWNELEERFQTRVSAALDAHPEDADAPPPIVERLAQAFSYADQAGSVLAFDAYVNATRAVQAGSDPSGALAKLGVSLPVYLRAHQHWVRAMTTDPALARRFVEALQAPRTG